MNFYLQTVRNIHTIGVDLKSNFALLYSDCWQSGHVAHILNCQRSQCEKLTYFNFLERFYMGADPINWHVFPNGDRICIAPHSIIWKHVALNSVTIWSELRMFMNNFAENIIEKGTSIAEDRNNHGRTNWRTSWVGEAWKKVWQRIDIFAVWEWMDGSCLYSS